MYKREPEVTPSVKITGERIILSDKIEYFRKNLDWEINSVYPLKMNSN
jgi:hypothetical protein